MQPNLKNLSQAILTYIYKPPQPHAESEKHWLSNRSEVSRRYGILNRFTQQGRGLAPHAVELAHELVLRGTEMDNSVSWGPVCTSLNYTALLLMNAARNGHFSKQEVASGYQSVLDLMEQNKEILAPTKDTTEIFKDVYNQIARDRYNLDRGKPLSRPVCRSVYQSAWGNKG